MEINNTTYNNAQSIKIPHIFEWIFLKAVYTGNYKLA